MDDELLGDDGVMEKCEIVWMWECCSERIRSGDLFGYSTTTRDLFTVIPWPGDREGWYVCIENGKCYQARYTYTVDVYRSWYEING